MGSESITLDELVKVVNGPGGTFGLAIAYVVIKTNVQGHGRHAVAVCGADPGNPSALVAENSWGSEKKRIVVTAANFVSAALIHPTLHFYQTGGSAEKKPAPAVNKTCKEFWRLFQAARSGVVGVAADASDFVTKKYASGAVYIGQMRQGEPGGQGAMFHENGTRMVGEWRYGKLNGCGAMNFPDGKKEAGEFRGGELAGCGAVAHPDGQKQAGEYRGGEFTGCGAVAWPDGQKQAGEFRDGEFNGCGALALPDGYKEAGDYRDGELAGCGAEVLPDGTKQAGEYLDGKIVGFAAVASPDGIFVSAGKMNEGRSTGRGPSPPRGGRGNYRDRRRNRSPSRRRDSRSRSRRRRDSLRR